MTEQKILGIDTNEKTVKGQKYGYMTGILYLAPVRLAGGPNVCPNASKGCAAACLFTAGRGVYSKIKNARIKKTIRFQKEREIWMSQLVREISNLVKNSNKKNYIPCVRLNGTSDVAWEHIKLNGMSVLEHYPAVQFYDYTKSLVRMVKYLAGGLPPNYHLTFSRSEENQSECEEVLNSGGNVAVVFGDDLPKKYKNFNVVVGDDSDLRFLDEKNVVVGLTAKGKARKDKSGFVVFEKDHILHSTVGKKYE